MRRLPGIAFWLGTLALAAAAQASQAWVPLASGSPEQQLLAARRPAIDALFDAYDYPPSTAAWNIATWSSPWLHNYALYRFDSADGKDRLDLVLARGEGPTGGPGWPLALAPDRRNGAGDRAPQTDPYNYAAFNATIARERPLPRSDAGWVQWAELFVALIGSDDAFISAANVHRDLGDRFAPAIYAPQAFFEGAGYTGVQVYAVSGKGVREYGMDFNPDGKLRNLLFVDGAHDQPPAPLRGSH